VLRNVLDAQAVSERFDLTESEALDVGELIVRYRLLVSTGEIPDVARTDPQTHQVARADDADTSRVDEESDTSISV
jgi:hypothetical protein